MFQEYVTRTQNEIAGIESKIEAEELKKLRLNVSSKMWNCLIKQSSFFWQKGYSQLCTND